MPTRGRLQPSFANPRKSCNTVASWPSIAPPRLQVEDYDTFARISAAVADRRIIIYANTPTDAGEQAADLERAMQRHGLPPS